MSDPVAKAAITLTEDERKRIASELGLDESQLDAVPKKIDLARYEVEEEAEVEGFNFTFSAQPLQTSSLKLSPAQLGKYQFGSISPGRLPGTFIVPV